MASPAPHQKQTRENIMKRSEQTDRALMREAIALAVENVHRGGGPFAALVVQDGEVVARGANRVTSHNDPTAHAEVVAIRKACAAFDRFHLDGCTLYTTCEPCPMCLGAIYWAHLDGVCYASTRDDAAAAGFDDARIYRELGRAPAERHLAMQQVLPGAARRVFEAWAQFDERVEY